MKLLYILILSSFFLNAQTDKVKHFYAGFGISLISSEIINQCIDRPTISALSGTGLGILAGILKESVYDGMMKKGVCDNQDAYMTIWGACNGGIIIRVKFDICDKKKHKPIYKDY